MIKVTGLDNKEMYINSDHIEKLEAVPESIITLTNGNKYLLKETNDQIVKLIIEYKRKIFNGAANELLKNEKET